MFEGCQGLSREFSERDGVVAMPGPVGWRSGIQLQQWTAVVMGPCVRRDDELEKSLAPVQCVLAQRRARRGSSALLSACVIACACGAIPHSSSLRTQGPLATNVRRFRR